MFQSPKVGDQVKILGGERGVICGDVSENFGFPMYEIKSQNGKTVTEARYCFDITGPGNDHTLPDRTAHNQGVLQQLSPLTTGRNSRAKERNGSKKRSRESSPFRDVRLDGSDDEFDEEFNNWMSSSQEEIQQFIKAQEYKNTAKKTNSNMTTLAKRLEKNRGETGPLQSIPPHPRPNSYLCKLFMDARKSNSENYEPSSLKGMLSSFNRHLREHNYAYCLIRSEEFSQLNMVIASKQMELKRSGRGNRPRKADCLTEDEVDRLYSSGQLGSHTPQALLRTVWFNNTIYFGMRGVQEHHDMKWGDLKLKQDGNGDDYVAFCERSSKGRTDPNNIRQVGPKMWATKENPERCPVRMFKKYSELTPTHYMKETDPFYVATCKDMNKSKKWFRGQPLGINKLGSFMKSVAKAAGLTDGGPQAKRLTNHSARKYVVQTLCDAGVPSNQVMQIIGGQAKRPKITQGPVSPILDPVTTMVSSQMSRTSSEQRESYTVNVSRGIDPGAGLCDIFIEAGILAEGSVDKVLQGEHWQRGFYAHTLVAEACERLRFAAFVNHHDHGRSLEILNSEIDGIRHDMSP